MNIKEEKKKLRKLILTKLKEHDSSSREVKNNNIVKKIVVNRFFNEAKTVMFYAAMTYEVDTFQVMQIAFQRKKRVVLPLMDTKKRDLMPCEIRSYEQETHLCEYGFREPNDTCRGNIAISEIDVIFVPGLCFDVMHNRLGRGAGYYDTFLSRVPTRVKKIGLAFDFQVLKSIPIEKQDVPLDGVICND